MQIMEEICKTFAEAGRFPILARGRSLKNSVSVSTRLPLSAVPISAWLAHYFAIYACLHPGQKDNSGLQIQANNKVLLFV